jgi:hypothetical protein
MTVIVTLQLTYYFPLLPTPASKRHDLLCSALFSVRNMHPHNTEQGRSSQQSRAKVENLPQVPGGSKKSEALAVVSHA